MKPARLFLLSLGFFSGFSTIKAEVEEFNFTGTIWADGVSQSGGWYDATKKDNNDGDADDEMCYAASAANLIAWWQNSEQSQHLISSAPKKWEDIWSTFVKNNQEWEEGGEALSAINWWISGVYAPTQEEEYDRYYVPKESIPSDYLPLTLPRTNGYYYDQYGLTQDNLANFLADEWVYGGENDDSDIDFYGMFEAGLAITLAIASDLDEDFGHAITLWGAEYDDGDLVKLWLTDSDIDPDGKGIFEVEVTLVQTDDDEKIYLDQYYGEKVYISGVYSLDPRESATWQLVPEPTTATMSLLALAALTTRRRRAK